VAVGVGDVARCAGELHAVAMTTTATSASNPMGLDITNSGRHDRETPARRIGNSLRYRACRHPVYRRKAGARPPLIRGLLTVDISITHALWSLKSTQRFGSGGTDMSSSSDGGQNVSVPVSTWSMRPSWLPEQSTLVITALVGVPSMQSPA
jgi:hypothetical protein